MGWMFGIAMVCMLRAFFCALLSMDMLRSVHHMATVAMD